MVAVGTFAFRTLTSPLFYVVFHFATVSPSFLVFPLAGYSSTSFLAAILVCLPSLGFSLPRQSTALVDSVLNAPTLDCEHFVRHDSALFQAIYGTSLWRAFDRLIESFFPIFCPRTSPRSSSSSLCPLPGTSPCSPPPPPTASNSR